MKHFLDFCLSGFLLCTVIQEYQYAEVDFWYGFMTMADAFDNFLKTFFGQTIYEGLQK